MSASLPARPDLEQLRRQAKELRDAANRSDADALARLKVQTPVAQGERVKLSAAQLTIARELGFPSWPSLKTAAEASGVDADVVSSFLSASIESRETHAKQILERSPHLGTTNIFSAAVLGERDAVAAFLAKDPALVQQADKDRGWPPLLYACYSAWPTFEPSRADGVLAVAQSLLDAGASPNSHNGLLPNRGYRSALHGAVGSNNVALVQLLLARGALVEDRVSLRAAAEHEDCACLVLLLDAGATIHATWALETAAHRGDAQALRLLVEAASRFEPAERVVERANELLSEVASQGDWSVLETLLGFGASPEGADGNRPPIREAARAGHFETARRLAAAGARDLITDTDRLLGACANADTVTVEALVGANPGLLASLNDEDRAVMVDFAANSDPAAVALMLELGFSVESRNDLGETALHTAAYAGRTETVRLLLARGASIEARDANFDATALAYATVGSGEHPNADGDWPGVVRLLLEAGASHEDVWLPDEKAPSDAVVAVLESFGVRPAPAEAERADPPPAVEPSSEELFGPLAARLTIAYESGDIDALAAVIHPEVRWGGGVEGCSSRADVVAWYGGFMELGLRGQVTSVEHYPGAFLVALSISRPAEGGAPAAPPAVHYQVFKVRDGLIGEISGDAQLDEARRQALRPASFSSDLTALI